MNSYAESLVKIGLVVVDIFGGICRFLPSRPKNAVVTLAISEVTGPVLIIFSHDVATILPLNIFESELPYVYRFRNASLMNEDHFANLVDMATSLEKLEEEVHIDQLQTNTNHLVQRSRKSVHGS